MFDLSLASHQEREDRLWQDSSSLVLFSFLISFVVVALGMFLAARRAL
jgi:hypothetical protein